ncbi:MAG: EamA family transporter [Eubacteriales bacterium]|nr:EamA family transporter [Eubacteriales bacterium]
MNDYAPKKNIGLFVLLHLCLLVSSVSGICSKMAATQEKLSGMILWYGGVLLIMGIYAIAWQQILKRLPLTVAYANKPVSLIWGMIWGSMLFREKITWNMILGAGIIFAGIYLVVTADE